MYYVIGSLHRKVILQGLTMYMQHENMEMKNEPKVPFTTP